MAVKWRSRPLPKFIVGPNAINGRQRRFAATTPFSALLLVSNYPTSLICQAWHERTPRLTLEADFREEADANPRLFRRYFLR